MPTNTPRLGLPKGNGSDSARDYLKGAIAGGGLWHALEVLDDAVLQSSVNTLNDVTLTSPNIGPNEWTDSQHTHASAATAGSTLGPGTTLSTPTLQTPAVNGVLTFGGDATLQRTAAGTLRVGGTGRSQIEVRGTTNVALSDTTAGSVLFNSLEPVAGTFQAAATGGAVRLAHAAGVLYVQTAPSVAAGAAQTFATRIQVAPTGAVTLSPAAGADTLSVGGDGIIRGPTTLTLATVTGDVYVAARNAAAGGYVMPAVDNVTSLGGPSLRWGQIYSSVPSISTSSREAKTDITPLDPAQAMAAVRATAAVTFTYTAPPRDGAAYALPDDPEAAEAELLLRLRSDPLVAAARHQAGFVAEDCDPLFLVGEGQTAAANSVGVLLAALHDLDQRLTAVEEGV